MRLLKICLIFLIISSCNTEDFSVYSDYKDITIVYGLLDQRDQTIYLKINKAFLGPDDALTYALEKDSSNYNNKLEVKILEYLPDGNLNRTFVFDTTTLYVKDTGVFYAPEQPLYVYTFPDDAYAEIARDIWQPAHDTILDTFWLFDGYKYKLEIYNQALDKLITSETMLINNFMFYPRPPTLIIDSFNRQIKFSWSEFEDGPKPANSSLFNFRIDFSYIEVYGVGETDTLSINLAASQMDYNSFVYNSDNFFESCKNGIPYKDEDLEANVRLRKLDGIILSVSVAAPEFHSYLMAFQPSNGIAQGIPDYTNINNGIGLFSSRFKRITKKHIQPEGTLAKLQQLNIKF